MTKEVKMIYRTIAQTENGLTITAETKDAVTMERAELDALCNPASGNSRRMETRICELLPAMR